MATKKKVPRPQKRSAAKRALSMPVITGDECMIAHDASDEPLNRFKVDTGNEYEADRITKYVEWECRKGKERVTCLEKVKTESVFGANHDCWNVRTDKERYWVITSPTNLYSQKPLDESLGGFPRKPREVP